VIAPRGFRSLRWRLTALIGAVAVLAIGVTFLVIYRGVGSEVRHEIDRELHGDGVAFDRGIPAHARTPAAVEAAAHAYLAAQPFRPSAHLMFLRVGNRPPVTNEPELLGGPPEPGENRGQTQLERNQGLAVLTARRGYSDVRLSDIGEMRILTAPLRRGPVTATIGIGEPLESVERGQHGVARTFVLAGTLTLLAALLAGYLVAVRTARPLTRMARIAQQVDAGDLSPRMAPSGSRDEIKVLADSFDHMLERLEDAFARQRAFAADASHELRTPLTVIRGQLEVLARLGAPSADDVARVERLVRTETLRMQRLVEDLLVLARADEREFVRPRPVELEEFVSDLFDGVAATADRRFERSPVLDGTLTADPDRLAQALRNLIRNAIEHTGPGGLVRLVTDARGSRVVFAVEDDGPGIPPEQRELVFARFHRVDYSRSRVGGGGAGLGLAIVHAIVTAHGGQLEVGESPEGGARVAFDLPGFEAGKPPRAAAYPPATSGSR